MVGGAITPADRRRSSRSTSSARWPTWTRSWTIADHGRVPVIEDAAQAIGAGYQAAARRHDRAPIGCFSFFPSKNLGGFGDGGMVVTRRRRPRRAAAPACASTGRSRSTTTTMVGGNFRLDALQAAVLAGQAPPPRRLDEAAAAARGRYRELFRQAGLVERTAGDAARPVVRRRRRASLPRLQPVRDPRPARCATALRDHLDRAGDRHRDLLPDARSTSRSASRRPRPQRRATSPIRSGPARETIALPIYPELTPEQQAYVVDRIAAFHRGQ